MLEREWTGCSFASHQVPLFKKLCNIDIGREPSLAIGMITDEKDVQEFLAWTHVDNKKPVLQCLNEP